MYIKIHSLKIHLNKTTKTSWMQKLAVTLTFLVVLFIKTVIILFLFSKIKTQMNLPSCIQSKKSLISV